MRTSTYNLKGVNKISDPNETLKVLYPKDWENKLTSAMITIKLTMIHQNINSVEAVKFLMMGQNCSIGFVALRAAQIWIN